MQHRVTGDGALLETALVIDFHDLAFLSAVFLGMNLKRARVLVDVARNMLRLRELARLEIAAFGDGRHRFGRRVVLSLYDREVRADRIDPRADVFFLDRV